MGSGDWFKTIITSKKVKQQKSNQVKKQGHPTKKSSGFKWRSLTVTGKESNGFPDSNCATDSKTKAGDVTMPIEDIAATRIQTAYRAYAARKVVRRLKGAVKVQAMIKGHTANEQAAAALQHIHFWSKMQAHIRARRLSMATQGRTRQKKLENQLKLEAKLHELEVEWSGGSETMEEILSRIHQREEAAIKRERAMAYAFSHQWRANPSPYFGQAYYDVGKESWGWSWMERWIAVRPWETRVFIGKKGHAGQGGSNKPAKFTNQTPIKILVSVKPALPNGKGATATPKARKQSSSNSEQAASQEGFKQESNHLHNSAHFLHLN